MGFKFALLKAFNETRVADVGSGVEVREAATRDHLVDLGEVGIFPMLADPLAIGFLDGSIIHSLFQIDSLIWIEGLVEMFVDESRDMSSERHLVPDHEAKQEGGQILLLCISLLLQLWCGLPLGSSLAQRRG